MNSKTNFCQIIFKRYLSMRSWQCFKYGGIEELEMSSTVRIPVIERSKDVLIKVEAASINPLDVEMLSGFGQNAMKTLRKINDVVAVNKLNEFPLTMGRDFSGTVVKTGSSARNLKTGDEVWGIVPFYQSGSHSDYVISSQECVCLKPKSLTHVEAASFPYVATTGLSATQCFGRIKPEELRDKRILLLGGSGGIGTFMIQWLKRKGAFVVTTASHDATSLLEKLGADFVVNYKGENVDDELKALKPYNVVLNAIAHSAKMSNSLSDLFARNSFGKYVTLSSPVLNNLDNQGLLLGSIKSALEYSCKKVDGFRNGYDHGWGFVIPNNKFLSSIHNMIENKEIVPTIEKVFAFEDLPQAYEHVKQGHSRGKIVIDMTK